ncbi:hypothetical protein [Bacillus xiapuensis]|uniref:Uncharacterized protein n=1 Tax=Bacillus xiapuensis TaxID=2014075 RepID=A0ABU6N886_9BACI|nr:hypothetical protein [Bacillus xiapuensis]
MKIKDFIKDGKLILNNDQYKILMSDCKFDASKINNSELKDVLSGNYVGVPVYVK